MDRSFCFDITSKRLEKVKKVVENHNMFPTVSTFINKSIDFYLEHLRTRFLSELMYYIGFPALAFIGLIGITLLFPTLFLYIITGILGVYLLILGFLFYNKYRGK